MITIAIPTTPERHKRLRELLDSIHEHTQDIEHRVLFFENNLGGWVPAVYKMLEGLNDEEYVILLGSDVVVEDKWLSTLWTHFIRTFPDGSGVAEPFNEFHHGSLCQHPLAKVKTIKQYLHVGYVHFYSDNEFHIRAVMEKKYLYVPEAKIEHRHALNGKAEMDSTYETVFNREQNEKDKALFYKRAETNFKD